jgi:DNA-binding NtrC family response regulator/predicted Ser/Thr protein kinase
MVPEVFDGYRLEALIGEGGFGVVHRAIAPSGETVAVKRLATAGADPEELADEFRLLARLRHAHIVPVLGFGFAEGRPYLATAWIDGTDLRAYGKGKDLRALAPMLGGVLRALEYIHARGVLHRDLKPQNIVVTPDGTAHLIDFGLAGVTGRGGSRSGTPAYAPPERLLGRPEDGRGDLYSFGVMLHELATGDLPAATGPRPSGDEKVDALLRRLLAANPAERPATANEVIAALSDATGVPLEEERGAPLPGEAAGGAAARVPGLVGREEELARFRRLLRLPRHRILVVEGEAGVGKTRLLAAFAAEACAGRARVREGRSLAEAAFGREDSGGADAADRLLADAEVRRSVILLDDLERALPAEAEAVVALATRLETRPPPLGGRGVVLVVAVRPSEARGRGLGPQLDRLVALGRTRRMTLGPLARLALPAFAAEVLGRAALDAATLDALHERSGGRPADLILLLGALRRGGAIAWERGAWRRTAAPLAFPPSAEEAIAAAVARLSDEEREALRWLAVAGPSTPAELRRLAPDARADRALLERLADEAGLLARSRGEGAAARFGVADDRVLSALGEDAAAARRHDALARERKDDPERRLDHAARGADAAAARDALAEAERRFDREPVRARSLFAALIEGPGLAREDRARAAVLLAEAETRLDEKEAARARLDAAEPAAGDPLEPAWLAARARAMGDADARREAVLARIEASLGRAPAEAAPFAEAALAAVAALEAGAKEPRPRLAALCERARRVAQERGDDRLRGRAALALGGLEELEGAAAKARERFEDAYRILQRTRDLRLELTAALRLAGHLARSPDAATAGLALADEAIALAERLKDRHELGRALVARSVALVTSGDMRGAWTVLRRARRHVAGRGPVVDFLRVLSNSAYVALKLGRAPEAERHARRALRLAVGDAHAQIRVFAHANLSFALVRQGKSAASTAGFGLAEATRRGMTDAAVTLRYLVALDAVERGHAARAEEALRPPVPEGAFHIDCLAVDHALFTGDVEAARAAVQRLRPTRAFDEAKALVRRALVQVAEGEPVRALTTLSDARKTGGAKDDWFLAIELHLAECEAALLAGRRPEAERALSEAQRLIVPRDMAPFHARAVVLRERLGGGGLVLAHRMDEMREALDRMETLGLLRDAAALAGVLAARATVPEEAERFRERARAAHRAMAAGLAPEAAEALLRSLAARLVTVPALLPDERPVDVGPVAAARLLSVYRAMARERDPDALLPSVLDAAAGLVGASRAFLLLRDGRRLRVVLGRGEGIAIDAKKGGPSRTIAEEALRLGRPLRIAGARSDARFSAQHSVASIGIGGALAVPLARSGEAARDPDVGAPEGVIYVDDGGAGRAFDAADEAVLAAFADQAALAIAAADMLRDERRRRERAERRVGELREEVERTAADLRTIRSILADRLDRVEQRFEGMIGRSDAMRKVFALVERAAPRDVPVLILGDTGTGKELTARALHARSPRRERPFVAVNCGAIAPSLLEAELFGHEAGAFTGARGRKSGLFEQATGGTIFLDEIGEMPLPMQAALLRVLESGELRRVGGQEAVKVDVRIIAATHRDLRAMVREGTFREDLLFRLDVFPIEIPPLRERLEDLPLLAESIVGELAEASGQPVPVISPNARRRLLEHGWPGNIRELRNVLARGVILSSGGRIGESAIVLDPDDRPSRRGDSRRGGAVEPKMEIIDFQVAKDRWIRSFLEAALKAAGGSVTRAADMTGMKRQAFGRLLTNHGIDSSAFRQKGSKGDDQ